MGIGLPLEAAAAWRTSDFSASYDELFMEEDEQYAYFIEFPEWAYDEDTGPFYIDPAGAVWGTTATMSMEATHYGFLAGAGQD